MHHSTDIVLERGALRRALLAAGTIAAIAVSGLASAQDPVRDTMTDPLRTPCATP